MDIESYLPYEGKVILYNKLAHTALVRIPSWVDLERLKGFVNGKLGRRRGLEAIWCFRN